MLPAFYCQIIGYFIQKAANRRICFYCIYFFVNVDVLFFVGDFFTSKLCVCVQVERKDLEKQMGDLGLEMDNKDDVRDHLIPFSSFFFFSIS